MTHPDETPPRTKLLDRRQVQELARVWKCDAEGVVRRYATAAGIKNRVFVDAIVKALDMISLTEAIAALDREADKEQTDV